MEKIFKHLKFYTLENDILRFEYSPNDHFSNQDTLYIASKKLSNEELEINQDSGLVSILYKGFEIIFSEEGTLESLQIVKEGKVVYKYKDIKNTGELPLPNKTPEVFPLMDSPRVLIPEGGYAPDSENFVVEDDVKDLFLLFCEKDHLKLRRQMISLTGKNKLPRFRNFGLFASKEYAYTQKKAIETIQKYESRNIPLETFVLCSDELKDKQYNINPALFANIEDFIRICHKRDIQVVIADKPHPFQEGSKVFDKEEIEFRNNALLKFYSQGLDGWWLQRSDKDKLRTGNRDISPESMGNYVYYDISRQFALGFTLDPEVYERIAVLSAIQDDLDSRGHVRSLQCGHHVKSDEQSLRNEIVNLNKYANNMVAHYSPEIGGTEGDPTKNQYIRWMQFGAFCPILRPHSIASEKKSKEPWSYDKTTFEICKTFINMRYALLNTFYTASFKNIDTGLGVCSPLSLYYPDDKKCYKADASFLIDGKILVAPLSGAGRPRSLKEKYFINGLKLSIYPNQNFKGKSYTRSVKSFEDINKFYNSVKARNPNVKKFSFRYKGDLKLKNEFQLSIKNDVKSRVFLNGKQVFSDFENHKDSFSEVARIKRNRVYKLVAETVQRRRPQLFDLVIYRVPKPTAKARIYLPEGEWFNIFHRNVYQGKRYVNEKFKIDEVPVFVKAGSLIPLYKKITNATQLSFKTAIYDYYTSKKEDISDFFYEDDGISTAYLIGEYRKNEYRTHFEKDRYIVELKGNSKLLDDELKVRDVFFKAHIRDNETIGKVLINGSPVPFKRHDHAKKAVPFLDVKFARDSKTLSFKFRHVIKDDYKIELIVKEK